MSTAIVRAQTKDGFIIAADGRETNFTTGEVLSENRQKIFQVGQSPAAYCATGSTLLGDMSDNLENVLFNFNQHLRANTAFVSTEDCVSMVDCAKRVCLPIYHALKKTCSQMEVDLPSSTDGGRGQYILGIFFDGYVKGSIAGRAKVRFFHEDRTVGEPEFTEDDTGVGYYGSDIVFGEMQAGITFNRFKLPIPPQSLQVSALLNNEIGASLYYLRSCSSDEARVLDPKCNAMGGRIHVAKITSRVGFRWVRGFEPISEAS